MIGHFEELSFDGQSLKEFPHPKAGSVEIMGRVAVLSLKERNHDEDFAAWFEHPREFRRASHRVVDVLQYGERQHGVKHVVAEGKFLPDSEDVCRGIFV